IILALRTDRGIPAAAVAVSGHGATFEWAAMNGLVVERDGHTVLTTAGRLLSNELFARLV
ncbi:MAG: hypothetical protein ACXW4H_04925, partial [Candidatus Limnocylindrales bacterium]